MARKASYFFRLWSHQVAIVYVRHHPDHGTRSSLLNFFVAGKVVRVMTEIALDTERFSKSPHHVYELVTRMYSAQDFQILAKRVGRI